MVGPSILVDTMVVSYILKGDSRARAAAPHLEGELAALSFQSVAELRYWPLKNNWGPEKTATLESLIKTFVTLAGDDATARAWAELKAEADTRGLSKQTADLWVAATAARHDLPLLTFDRGFLSGIGVRVVDPTGSEP